MKGITRRLRPSPAMVVACIALVFAMTGAGYAAGMLGPNTVGTKQLKKNAVISSKVKNRSLLAVDFKAGQLPKGPKGDKGDAGAPGAPGAPGQQGPPGPTTGLMRISASSGDWVVGGTSVGTLTIRPFTDLTRISTSATGIHFAHVHPSLPEAAFGKRMSLESVVFCYDAAPNAVLDATFLRVQRQTAGPPGTNPVLLSDDTDRADAACRTYTLPTPFELSPDDAVNFAARINFTNTTDVFDVGRTTFVLEPTATPATPAGAPAHATMLKPVTRGDSGSAN